MKSVHAAKVKGDLGVAFTIASLTEQGWNVALPISEHQHYDLIAEKEGQMRRIQVKYCVPQKGKLVVRVRSIYSDRKGIHVRKREASDFDTLAIFDSSVRKTFYIRGVDFSATSGLTLRRGPAENGQVKGVRRIEDFASLT